MPVPNTFANVTTSIPLSNLDNNFATPITIGNTAVQLGNTVTTLNNMTLANVTISSGNTTVTSETISGNLSFTGTGNRIIGDFTNATLANRVAFQSSTTNSATVITALPNGTSTQSQWEVFNASDPTNAARGQFLLNASELSIRSQIAGTGTYLPMTFYTGGSERMRVDTSGNVGIGTSSPNYSLEVNQSGGATIYSISDTAANIGAFRYSNDTGQALVVTRKARGTQASPSAVQTGDVIGQWVSQAYGGTNWRPVATIDARISNYTSDTNISSFITFSTNNASTNVSERARITSGGEVYIAGTTDQGAYNLQCNGTGVWGAGAYVNGSDERIKEDIAPLTSGLDVVTKLNPVTYRYKEDWSKDQSIQPGFIAQEMLVAMEGQDYVDGVVSQGGAAGYYSVAYQNIIPLLTKAIQEQQQMIETLQAKVAALEGVKK